MDKPENETVKMDKCENDSTCEDTLCEMKSNREMIKSRCHKAQEDLEKKVSEISSLDKDISKTEYELAQHKLETKSKKDLWLKTDMRFGRVKWMQEKSLIILESIRNRHVEHLRTLDIIKRNHIEMTAGLLKTRRQEAVRKIIGFVINELSDRKVALERELEQSRAIKAETESKLSTARKELITEKAQVAEVRRLESKLQESEAAKNHASLKLNNLKK